MHFPFFLSSPGSENGAELVRPIAFVAVDLGVEIFDRVNNAASSTPSTIPRIL
jgi:hypothetical protein